MKSTTTILGVELNTQQHEAVMHSKGALLVVAGAGSGKTRVITTRIARLMLHEHVDPRSIIALTFTNKAAKEMKERIACYVGEGNILPYIGTFHSYCLYLLRSNPQYAPYESFSILDGDDQVALIKKMLKKHGLEKQLSHGEVLHQVSRIKNQLLPVDASSFEQPIMHELYNEYEQVKQHAHCLDFDDLLLTIHELLKNSESFRTRFHETIKHILVDEYQDTNIVQHQLLKLMSTHGDSKLVINSICAVGDEDQSIYSWRGANVKNMLTFKQDFSPVTAVKIEQNYRSVSPILEAANEVISQNSIRNPKALWSTKKAKNRILALSCRSEYQEADALVACIKTLPKSKRDDVAILYRTHYQSRVIEEMLLNNSIPYHMIGGLAFYARKEIKDLLAYLRLIANPFDRVSLLRVINTPTRGLGAKFEEALIAYWQEHPLLDFMQLLSQMREKNIGGCSGKKALTIESFRQHFATLSPKEKPSVLLETILEKTRYIEFLRTNKDAQDAQSRVENVQELLRSAQHFEQMQRGPQDEPATLESFLHSIALLQEKIEQAADDGPLVQMMTLHAAKGLEFDTVMLAGLEDGIFPSSRSLYSQEELEEERRLFYVGMTRAKEHLVLSRAYFRNQYGTIIDQKASRFLTEIPSQLLQQIDVSNQSLMLLESQFKQWVLGKPVLTSSRQQATPARSRQSAQAKKLVAGISFTPATAQQKTQKRKIGGSPWRKNSTVVHATFGPGLIKKAEKRSDGTYFITAQFKSGEKKVLSTFLKTI